MGELKAEMPAKLSEQLDLILKSEKDWRGLVHHSKIQPIVKEIEKLEEELKTNVHKGDIGDG
jgi:hypothetical protein